VATLVTETATFFAALSHPVRLGVLDLLDRLGPSPAGTLGAALGVEASALSHQLRVLREHRLVEVERRGRQMIYRLHDHHVAHIVRDAIAHTGER
jgi:DNA-binding transcriptional ArsR family regulator